MLDIEREIENSLKELKISDGTFIKLSKEESNDILQRSKKCFVSTSEMRYWWSVLQCRSIAISFKDNLGYKRLNEIIPQPNQLVYFIVNVDEASSGDPGVYLAQISTVIAIISHSYAFEYYLMPLDFSWLLCENHHNELIATGFAVIRKIKLYVQIHQNEISRIHINEID